MNSTSVLVCVVICLSLWFIKRWNWFYKLSSTISCYQIRIFRVFFTEPQFSSTYFKNVPFAQLRSTSAESVAFTVWQIIALWIFFQWDLHGIKNIFKNIWIKWNILHFLSVCRMYTAFGFLKNRIDFYPMRD